MMPTLNDDQRKALFAEVLDWILQSGHDAVQRTFASIDFNATSDFVTCMAIKAEQMNHHPEWFNMWNRADIMLSTHDTNGFMHHNTDLARSIEQVAKDAGTTGTK